MATFVTDPANDSGKFSAFLKLDSLDLPGDAQVIVEAYRQSISERFSYGTVANAFPKDPAVLKDLHPAEVAFRVKVVDVATGQVLARGDKFRPGEGEDSGLRPLMKLIVRDLGKQPWFVERGDAGMQLVLNARIEEAEKRIQADRIFRGLILPAALRQVLLLLWAERIEDEDDDEPDALWFRFAENLGCPAPESLDADDAAAHEWIDAVCAAFCEREDYAAMVTGEDAQ
jgi:hypothetical protein